MAEVSLAIILRVLGSGGRSIYELVFAYTTLKRIFSDIGLCIFDSLDNPIN